MIADLKTAIKKRFPKSVLRWRTRRLIAAGIEPDLDFLATIRRHLPAIRGGEKLCEYFTKRHTAIDVGACGGEYSCVMATMFSKVLTIEPTTDMAALLRRSLPINCELLECALGSEIGTVSIRVPKINGFRMNALSTVTEHNFDFSDIDAVDVDLVRQTTIDQLVSERRLKPSFIKIDVEGYEGSVLLGARQTVQVHRPVLMIEIEQRHNRNYLDIFTLLDSYGYSPFHFRHGKLSPSGAAMVEESFQVLHGIGVSGMKEMIALKVENKYLNNFIFLPPT